MRPEPDVDRPLQLALFGAILALSALAYAPALQGYFLADDFGLIRRAAAGGPFDAYSESARTMFVRPINALSIWIDQRLFGLEPAGYHATNLLLHALAAFLVFRMALRLGQLRLLPARDPELPMAAGLLFALLHAHTESVAWISGRTDLLCVAPALASLDQYLGWKQRGGRRRLAFSLALFGLALGAKEAGVALPALVAVLAWNLAGRAEGAGSAPRAARVLRDVAPFAALLAAYLVVRTWRIGALVGDYGASLHLQLSPGQLLENVWRAVLRLLIPVETVPWHAAAGAALLLAALAAGALAGRRLLREGRAPAWGPAASAAGLLLALYLAALLPVVYLPVRTSDTLGERALYFATAFGSIALGVLALGAVPRGRWRALALIGLCVYQGAGTRALARDWKEASELSERSVARLVAEDPAQPIYLLGVPAAWRGAYVLYGNVDDAVRLIGGKGRARVHTLAYTYLHGPDDVTAWRRSRQPREILFRHSAAMAPPLHQLPSPDYEVEPGLEVMRVRFAPGLDRVRLGAFSRGELSLFTLDLRDAVPAQWSVQPPPSSR